MGIVDFILNMAGLLLWFGWKSSRSQLVVPNAGVSILATLKRADVRQQRGHLLPLLLGMLLVRGLVYWQIGSAVGWSATLSLPPVAVTFPSRYPGHMFLFSFLSFGLALLHAMLWLAVLSLLHSPKVDNLQNRFVRTQLGWLDRWPGFLRILVPGFIAFAAWMALAPILTAVRLNPPAINFGHLAQQAGVIALGLYLSVKYLFALLLLAQLVNTYVYLGSDTIWTYVQTASATLLRPLQWIPLRFGSIDLTPVLGIAILFLVGELADGIHYWNGKMAWEGGLIRLYRSLPLF